MWYFYLSNSSALYNRATSALDALATVAFHYQNDLDQYIETYLLLSKNESRVGITVYDKVYKNIGPHRTQKMTKKFRLVIWRYLMSCSHTICVYGIVQDEIGVDTVHLTISSWHLQYQKKGVLRNVLLVYSI